MVDIPKEYKNKEEYVHNIFSGIAKKYDVLNTTLSFNRDKYWRRFAVAKSGLKPGQEVLDICCGTGMLSLELARYMQNQGRVIGLDFCENMLEVAQKNIAKTPYANCIELVQGNAIDLPFAEDSFDCCTIAFALRNVPDVRKTIQEMKRVVKPGGRVINLEFSKPSAPVFKQLYHFYLHYILPVLGKIGIGRKGPYNYLSQSVQEFTHQAVIRDLFVEEGLENAVYYELTGGIATVHVGIVPQT